MTGGGPVARQRRCAKSASNRPHLSILCSRVSKNCPNRIYFCPKTEHLSCHCLETIRQFYPKAAPVLHDHVLHVKLRRRVNIMPVQQVVHAR